MALVTQARTESAAMNSKRRPPHVTGAAALSIVGAAIFFVHWAINLQSDEPSACPPIVDIDRIAIRCASGESSACDEFASMTDQCVIQWFDSRLMIEPVSAEGEDITV